MTLSTIEDKYGINQGKFLSFLRANRLPYKETMFNWVVDDDKVEEYVNAYKTQQKIEPKETLNNVESNDTTTNDEAPVVEYENGMFNNIAKKIKNVAEIVCYLGIGISIVCGIIIIFVEVDLLLCGVLIAGIGSLASWLGSLMTYGFGQLIENTDILVAEKKRSDVSAQNHKN